MKKLQEGSYLGSYEYPESVASTYDVLVRTSGQGGEMETIDSLEETRDYRYNQGSRFLIEVRIIEAMEMTITIKMVNIWCQEQTNA